MASAPDTSANTSTTPTNSAVKRKRSVPSIALRVTPWGGYAAGAGERSDATL